MHSIELEQVKYDIKRLVSRSKSAGSSLQQSMSSELFGKWQFFEAMLNKMEHDLFKGDRKC